MKNTLFMSLIMLMGMLYGETSQDVLALLGSPNAEIRKSVVGKISDNDILRMVALGDPDEKVRVVAIRKITDQKMIANILYENPSNELTIAVLGHALGLVSGYEDDNLSDQTVLKDLARRCMEVSVLSATNEEKNLLFRGVMNKITDESFLLSVFDKAWNDDIRCVVLHNETIKNISFLRRVIDDSEMSQTVKKAAIARLPDEELLAMVSPTSRCTPEIRKDALRELVGSNFLSNRRYQSKKGDVLTKNLNVLLELILANEEDSEKVKLCDGLCCRLRDNQVALADVLKKIDDAMMMEWPKVGLKAHYIRWIDDLKLIDEILENSKSEEVYFAAEEHIRVLITREEAFKTDLFEGL